jgi:deoxyribose-phosphate aldolase
MINLKKLANYLDLANHKGNCTPRDVEKLCKAVIQYGFHSAFVNPYYVPLAKNYLKNSEAALGTVVAFPLGQESHDLKILMVVDALKNGADELDVSMNVGLLRAQKDKELIKELDDIVTTAKGIKPAAIVKIIIETGYLTADEIRKAAKMVVKSGADFVKTCSGMGPRGAKPEDVDIIAGAIEGSRCKIKVAGGIETYQQAKEFIERGASRVGTSHAIEIITQAQNQ